MRGFCSGLFSDPGHRDIGPIRKVELSLEHVENIFSLELQKEDFHLILFPHLDKANSVIAWLSAREQR